MITNHVTDYKRSKKLAKYLPQEGGLFYWVVFKKGPKAEYKRLLVKDTVIYLGISKDCYRAYLSTELNEFLPDFVDGNSEYRLQCIGLRDKWYIRASTDEGLIMFNDKGPVGFEAKQEQNAKAECILYLIKEGVIKL